MTSKLVLRRCLALLCAWLCLCAVVLPGFGAEEEQLQIDEPEEVVEEFDGFAFSLEFADGREIEYMYSADGASMYREAEYVSFSGFSTVPLSTESRSTNRWYPSSIDSDPRLHHISVSDSINSLPLVGAVYSNTYGQVMLFPGSVDWDQSVTTPFVFAVGIDSAVGEIVNFAINGGISSSVVASITRNSVVASQGTFPLSSVDVVYRISGQSAFTVLDTFTADNRGVVVFPISYYSINQDVDFLGFRLNYSVSPIPYVSNFSTSSYIEGYWYYNFSFSTNSDLEYFGSQGEYTNYLLQLIINQLRSTNTVISNGFADILQVIQNGVSSIVSALQNISSGSASTPEQDAAAFQYVQDMEDTLDKIDEANQIIEDNTNRPSMEELRPPDISTIVDASDPGYAAAMEGIGNFLASDFMVNILLLMCTMAFCGYVLFGKKG